MIYRYLFQMFVGLMTLVLGGLFFKDSLHYIFFNNPWLNTSILTIIAIGIIISLYQIIRIQKEHKWLQNLQEGSANAKEPFKKQKFQPTILFPLKLLFEQYANKPYLPHAVIKPALESIELRLDDSHEWNRYIMGVLVFLGLLGTFWGLSHTIGAVSDVINGLHTNANEMNLLFEKLKEGLRSPLSGMGMAFSSSLFGITGSLIVGFFDLQLSKAGRHFLRNLENQLTLLTSPITSSSVEGGYGKAYTSSIIDQTAEMVNQLYQTVIRQEDFKVHTQKTFDNIHAQLILLNETMLKNQTLLKDVLLQQKETFNSFDKFSTLLKTSNHAIDNIVGKNLCSIDSKMSKALEEMIQGREHLIHELRNEIRIIARTISSMANDSAA